MITFVLYALIKSGCFGLDRKGGGDTEVEPPELMGVSNEHFRLDHGGIPIRKYLPYVINR